MSGCKLIRRDQVLLSLKFSLQHPCIFTEAPSFSPNLASIHWITLLVWPYFYQSGIITAVTPPGPFRAEGGLTALHVQNFRWDEAVGVTM